MYHLAQYWHLSLRLLLQSTIQQAYFRKFLNVFAAPMYYNRDLSDPSPSPSISASQTRLFSYITRRWGVKVTTMTSSQRLQLFSWKNQHSKNDAVINLKKKKDEMFSDVSCPLQTVYPHNRAFLSHYAQYSSVGLFEILCCQPTSFLFLLLTFGDHSPLNFQLSTPTSQLSFLNSTLT